jgi:hypothetical protein
MIPTSRLSPLLIVCLLAACGGESTSGTSNVSSAPSASASVARTATATPQATPVMNVPAQIVSSTSSTPAATAVPTTTGVALIWTAPADNTDDSPLTALTGYRIYYGSSPTELSNTIEVSGGSVVSYVVPDLTAGTWYFAVTAVTADDTESNPTSLGNVTI